ncbi:36491_t:CDS:1, partial [Racocetra persica]
KQLYKEVAQFLVDCISKADRFSWTYHKYEQLNNSVAFIYYCNSRDELKNKKPRTNQRDTTIRIQRHDCGGTIRINIDQLNNLVVVNIYHFLHSPPEAKNVTIQI